MEKTPITKLSEAAESGIITSSPALWEEWKKTMEEAFRQEIIKAVDTGFEEGSKFPEDIKLKNAEDYYEQRFGKQQAIKPATFICKGCNHELPMEFNLRTEGYCHLCDPNITLEECLSDEPIKR